MKSILLVYLLIMSLLDLKKQRISFGASVLCFLLLLIIRFAYGSFYPMMFLGSLVGVALIVISRITGDMIGVGDGVVFCISGLILGLYENISLLIFSFILAAVMSIILLLTKRAGRKSQIPFVPFICVAFGGMMIYG